MFTSSSSVRVLVTVGAVALAIVGGSFGCSFNAKPGAAGGGGPGSGGNGASGSGGVSGTGSGGTVTVPPYTGPCRGLECQQTTCTKGACKANACAGGAKTTVSGTVYDPAGKVPLYNVIVYVPNAPLDPIKEGASCDKCDAAVSGNPIASALTDVKGEFRIENVPVGSDIPLVIQIGKWRREIKVPAVAACADTAMADKNVTRLPRNRGEGHIPKIALTTGGADALECLLRKIGLEDGEFTPEAGPGRVNLFNGQGGTAAYSAMLNGGAPFTAAPGWWDSGDNLKKYDIVLHSCEGTENPSNKSVAARQALQDYAGIGGRVFASHWHNYWMEHGPAPFPSVATFKHQADLANPFTATIDVTFPKGIALADWLVNVGGSTARGQLVINAAQHTVEAVNGAVAQRWIYSDTPQSVQYLTFNTPMAVQAANQCGRVVLSDIHVSSGDQSGGGFPFPAGCRTTDLSPQEKALEFMLFDLSSCIRRDIEVPVPPVVQ